MVGPIRGKLNKWTLILGITGVVAMLACASAPPSDEPSASEGSLSAATQKFSEVDVDSSEAGTVIRLVGLEDPSYSEQSMEEENVLVLELPGVSQSAASLFDAMSDSESQISVFDGLVDEITTSTWEGDDSPTTRLEIRFAAPADYQIVSSLDGFSIHVQPAVAGDVAEESQSDAIDAAAIDPWAEDELLSETDAMSPSDAEILATTMDDGEVLVPENATSLREIRVVSTQAGTFLHLVADGMLTSAESFTLDGPDRLVVDLPGIENRVPQNKIAVKNDWVERVRIGSHPDKLRIVLDGGPKIDAFQGRRLIPANDGLVLSVGSGDDLDAIVSAALVTSTLVAMEETPSEPVEVTLAEDAWASEDMAAMDAEVPAWEEPIEAVAISDDAMEDEPTLAFGEEAAALGAADMKLGAAPAEIYGLQYDRTEQRDRIAVLSDKVMDFEVHTPDAETVMISIRNAVIADAAGDRIAPKLGGPVSMVTTFQQPDVDGNEVRVVMRRAPGLEPQISPRGSLLFIDFENTGVAAAAPPAFIPGEPLHTKPAMMAGGIQVSDEMDSADAMPGADPLAMAASQVGVIDVAPVASIDEDPMATLTDESYAALPEFDEAASLATEEMALDANWTGGSDAAGQTASPASLEPPAAVEMLEEGGLIDGKEYAGRRISLDFKDVEISDVLRLIAEVSDLNVIAGDEVKGTITIRLVDVPWDQALDVILLTKGLGFVRVGNVLRIAPAEILKVEEEVRLQERRNKEKLEDLEVKLQPVNYAGVTEVAELVMRLLSPRGTVNTDKRTNTLIIKDISSVIDEATALITAIDTQTPQVMIEAKIVEANLEFGRELGTQWGFGSQPWQDGFNPGDPRTDLGNENFKFAGQNSVAFSNPITSVATGAVSLGAFLLDDKMAVEVHIEAMEASGDGKVISSPRIVTLDNREALIEQGVSIPFQTFEGGDAKLEFIDAVLSLKVTPHITTDKSIIMQIEVTRNAPDASVSTPTGSPAIAKNQAKTETLVKDGQTLVIGGIYTVDKTERSSRVPYLHRIPVLGAAFKSKEVSDIRKELLIFVTPRVVVNPALAQN